MGSYCIFLNSHFRYAKLLGTTKKNKYISYAHDQKR